MTAKRRPTSGSQRQRYHHTVDALADLLSELAPGTFLPAEPELAASMGVSRATLREAMRPFVSRGVVVRRRGVGSYVAKPSRVIESGLEVLTTIESLASSIGVEIELGELQVHERLLTPETAPELGLGSPAPVLEVARVIAAEKRPIAYLVDRVPTVYLSKEDLGDDFQGSVLKLLIDNPGLELHESRAEITALGAPDEIAEKLAIEHGEVLLFLEARLLARNGAIIDHSLSYFLPGIFRFNIVRRVQL